MDWNASFAWIIAAAFWVGALHALEPGHGKSIMGAYLVAAHGGIRHAFLLGLMVTLTHMLVVILLAVAALRFAAGQSDPRVTFWLEVVSGALVVAVGLWMILTSFNLVRRRRAHLHAPGHEHGPHDHVHAGGHAHSHEHPHDDPHGPGHAHEPGHEHPHEHAHPHSHPHPHPHVHGAAHEHTHAHPHPHPHDHGAAHEHTHPHPHDLGDEDDDEHFARHGHRHSVQIPAGKNPLGFWTLVAVGASGGLVPCPAAITALLAAVNLGRTREGIAVVIAMSLGIAATLIAIGLLFVQAGRIASRLFATRGVMHYAPRISAIVVTGLGVVLLVRAFSGHPD